VLTSVSFYAQTEAFMTLFFQIFQNFQQIFPYPLYGRDGKLLFCSMNILHIRAKRNAVQSRNLLIEKSALKSRVDHFYLWSGMIKFFINIHHIGAEFRILLILPGGIVSFC